MISSPQNRAMFPGDGVSTQFDFSFPAQKAADLLILRRSALGVVRALGLFSDYSISLAGNGGRLTLASALLVGERLAIVRAPALVQDTDLKENDTYSAETIEATFDYGMMVSQRLADLVSRALVLSDADIVGAGAFVANSNRITALADGVSGTDAVTLGQVQSLIAAGGGGGGGGGPIIGPIGWPSTPPPSDVLGNIVSGLLSAAEFQAVFTPINSQIGSLSSSILSNNSQISSINTSIGTLNTTITGMQAAINLLAQLQGDGTAIVALITTEQTARIAADNAMAALVTKIGTADPDGFSFLINTSTAKIGPAESLAQRFGSIQSSLSGNSSAITSETTARTTADTALSQTIAKMGALTNGGAAFLLNVDTAWVAAGESLAQRLSSLAVSINGASSAISTESSVRATADASLSTQVSTLQSTVGGFTSSIQANATAINGVYAQYSVKVDNNGRVAGFGLISQPINGSIVSSFIFNADAFSIYNGASAVAPFLVTGGVVRMQNVEIVNANITSLSIAKLSAGALNADLLMGTGRIISTNGSVMEVQGVGFGSSGQFMRWTGPYNADLTTCTEANASSYLKTNGTAYFGGSLLAGTIRIAFSTTENSSTAQVQSPDFTTNGGTKTIVCSFNYSHTARKNAGTGVISGGGTVTVVFEKSTNSGSTWATIATLNLAQPTGTVIVDGDPAIKDFLTYTMSGATSVTDNTGATSSMQLRARVTARTIPTFNGTGTSNDVQSQFTGFISTE